MIATNCENCGRHALCDWVPETAKVELPHWRSVHLVCAQCMRQVAVETNLLHGFAEAQRASAIERLTGALLGRLARMMEGRHHHG